MNIQDWLADGGEAIITGEAQEVLDKYGAVSIKGFSE